MRVLVTTFPFAEEDKTPLQILKKEKIDFTINPFNRKIKETELYKIINNFDAVIAGTEKYSKKTLLKAEKLKLISRVGIGLDGIDLNFAKKKSIHISYTPDAPSNAVAELTIANILTLIRNIHVANLGSHKKKWRRYFGYDLNDTIIGIIGAGRIGSLVVKKLFSLGVNRIFINDIKRDNSLKKKFKEKIIWTSKLNILKKCNVISIHIPLYNKTKNFIDKNSFNVMRKDCTLINTSRGGVVCEKDLFFALNSNKISSAAIDVFEKEPYYGPLSMLNNCLLTSHMGSMTFKSRALMEIEATKEIVRFKKRLKLKNSIPEYEYDDK